MGHISPSVARGAKPLYYAQYSDTAAEERRTGRQPRTWDGKYKMRALEAPLARSRGSWLRPRATSIADFVFEGL